MILFATITDMAPHRTFDGEAREKVAFLSDSRNLVGRRRKVRIIETHFAWVFLVGRRVYKLKKATRQASMDYRSVASRRAGCRAELRLNRRLAPGVYVRTVPLIRDRSGSLRLGHPQAGRIVDWLIEMRRLPAARMLDRAIARHRVRPCDVERLIRRLTQFFHEAKRRPLGHRAYLMRLRRQILGNARELRALDLELSRRLVRAVVTAQLRFIAAGEHDLAGRGERLADGHGDLRPEHIYLGSAAAGPCVVDCLEFDPDLRRLDPAEELAFLALECARLGAPRLADELIGHYRRMLPDTASAPLIHFYMSRRAAVRAQIMAWHLRDTKLTCERPLWTERAHSYLEDALRHARIAWQLLSRQSMEERRLPAADTP